MFSIGDFAAIGRVSVRMLRHYDAVRLAGVAARLRIIEREGSMNTEDVVLKPVPPVRVAELSGVAASYEGDDITPVIQPLYRQLMERLGAAGVAVAGPTIAYYVKADDAGEAVVVHAAAPVRVTGTTGYDFDVVDLPGIESAATIIHRGSMDNADQSMQILARWIDDNGLRMDGYAREVCLEFDPDDPDRWVHEFQIALVRN